MPDSTKKKKWLVKDNDCITGPFTETKIQKILEAGEISPSAMGCLPNQACWIFLINYPEFASWAEKIITADTNITKTLSNINTDYLNFDTTTKTFLITDTHTIKTPVQAPPPTDSNKTNNTKETTVPYQTIEDSHAPPKITNKITTIIQSVFIVFCLGMTVWLIYKRNNTPVRDTNNKKNIVDSAQMASMYFSSGYYTEAIPYLEKAKQNGTLNKQNTLLLKMAQLKLQNKVELIKNWLQAVDNKNINLETKKMIQAIMHLKTNKEPAARQIFEKLRRQPATSQKIRNAAKINSMLLEAKNNHCIEVQPKELDSIIDKTFAHTVKALCTLSNPDKSTGYKNSIQKTKLILKDIAKTPQAYYQEALLGLIYISVLEKNQKKDTLQLIKQLLDSNPFLTKNYYFSIFIDINLYTWKDWIPLCKKVYTSNQNNSFYQAFFAYCLSKANKHALAIEYIKKVNHLDSNNPLIKAIYAYILYQDKNLINSPSINNQFILLISEAVQSNEKWNYFFPYILQAEFCRHNQDWKCAIQQWQLISQNDPVSSYSGIATAYYHKGKYKEAKQYMDYGLEYNFSHRYKPLQLLQQQLKNY